MGVGTHTAGRSNGSWGSVLGPNKSEISSEATRAADGGQPPPAGQRMSNEECRMSKTRRAGRRHTRAAILFPVPCSLIAYPCALTPFVASSLRRYVASEMTNVENASRAQEARPRGHPVPCSLFPHRLPLRPHTLRRFVASSLRRFRNDKCRKRVGQRRPAVRAARSHRRSSARSSLRNVECRNSRRARHGCGIRAQPGQALVCVVQGSQRCNPGHGRNSTERRTAEDPPQAGHPSPPRVIPSWRRAFGSPAACSLRCSGAWPFAAP